VQDTTAQDATRQREPDALHATGAAALRQQYLPRGVLGTRPSHIELRERDSRAVRHIAWIATENGA